MTKLTRRDFLVSTAAAAAATTLSGSAFAAEAGTKLNYTPEKGATLRVLRWKRFVQGDEDLWMANTKKFTEQTGIPVRIDNEGWEDVRPKAAVAARVGSGPDIIIGWFDDPEQYPEKLVDVSDLGTYLDKKYGGWYDVCKKYGMKDGKWIAIPLGVVGNALVYRQSMIKAAGFDTVPKDLAGFLKLCQALKAKNTPAGFAFGHAVGDGNNFAHWLLWSHGGMLVNKKGHVVVESPETVAALEYARELYKTFIPGTLAWQDPSNNKAFLDSQISLTANGISVYYAAKKSADPKMQAIALDIEHAHLPVGSTGKHTELMQITQMMLFKYSKYPKAAKAFMQFMMEADQYNPWMQAAIGYVSQPLKAYEANPIWTSDPKATVFRDSAAIMIDNGHAGPLGTASAAVMADYVVVDMFAAAASGSKTPKEAAKQAAERAKRYYKA
ncbi:ABC transporter substrate-binding protein [Paralcaligenes ureilyticus]|uniref:Carbohydrate ABC transporter substrate-binding protein (CUT1 family) n=1 Tax=Paralcaligenes ureilyticus TaxID=627131 RepID=A0A4R3LPF0_9BURK|nr:extracellular solute-binding protein [Paralcaligenes ureilyticus]TCT02324.1 carbohydrate ABC transporter substrate-binding protein (CUT1 family) [Paralcaligenes ureilyticus]